MNPKLLFNKKGVSLIELLVALVISAIIIAGIYRVFIAQTRAYAVQDQVVEVQQNVRSAMDLMLRDIRMAGYRSNINPVTLAAPIFPGDNSLTVRTDAIRIEYQRNVDCNGSPSINPRRHTVVYYRDANAQLMRELYVDGNPCPTNPFPEPILQNVNALNFTYGVDGIVDLDTSQDGGMDDRNGDGIVNDNDWVSAGTVNAGNLNIITIRVSLTAGPSNPGANPDIGNIVPRNLVSTVNLRNLCLVKSN
jgi:prepilin-type N-terminal cleavage/methylation domain-containing protein